MAVDDISRALGFGGTVPVDAATSPGLVVPPFRQFAAAWNLNSKVYSHRWDEARRNSVNDAKRMWLDAYFRALIQERTVPLTSWPWEVVADADDVPDESPMVPVAMGAGGANPKDPHSADREKVAKNLSAVVRRTAGFHQLRQYLGQAVWFGRYGAQFRWDSVTIGGERRQVVGYHDPIGGDKVHYTYDGYPGVMISPQADRGPDWDVRTFDNFGPVLILNRPELRSKFLIHRHVVEDADYMDGQAAGRRHGVGIRDMVYWAWWLRDQMLAWLMGFMEKVGSLGILCFFYNESNNDSKTAAEKAAAKVGSGNALAIPVKATDPRVNSVEQIPANTTGAQFLKEVVGDYFERHIERLIVGQSLSAGTEGSGLGGTGVADFHAETKFYLLEFDANNLAETFTSDLVAPALELNFRGCPWRYQFKFLLPDPKAKDKLDAAQKLTSMGVTIVADEAREAGAFSKPGPADETVGGQQMAAGLGGDPMAGGGMGPGGGPDPMGMGAPVDPNAPQDDGQPVPGMAELVNAMVRAGASGNVQAVKALAKLGEKKDKLAELVDNAAGESTADATDDTAQPLSYRWQQASSQSGKIKAVWSGPGERAPLYGAEAEAALRGQDRQPGPDESRNPNKAGQASGGARMMQQFRQQAVPHRERARQVYEKAVQNPGGVRPHELNDLADHINTMTAADLRQVSKQMQLRSGGLKEDLVRRLLEHVGGGIGESAMAARGAGFNFDVKSGEAADFIHRQPGASDWRPAASAGPPKAAEARPAPSQDWRPAAGDQKPAEPAPNPEKPQETPAKPAGEQPKPDGNKIGVELPDAPPVSKAIPVAKPAAEPAAPAAGGGSSVDAWVKRAAAGTPRTDAIKAAAEGKKRYRGATEAAKKKWAENAKAVEKHMDKLKARIEHLDKKETFANYVKNNHGKILWDSEMETVFGSIKDAIESGFPRGLITAKDPETAKAAGATAWHVNDIKRDKKSKYASSIDQIAEAMQNAGTLNVPSGRHATEFLIEKIMDGARADLDESGERHALAEELYHLEANRDGTPYADAKLAEVIRRSRRDERRKARAAQSEGADAGNAKVAGTPEKPSGDGAEHDTDPGYFDEHTDTVGDFEYGHDDAERELDDYFGHLDAEEPAERQPGDDEELDQERADWRPSTGQPGDNAGMGQKPVASGGLPDWYPKYRDLRNRADMGGKMSDQEKRQLESLEAQLRSYSLSSFVKPPEWVKLGQYRPPQGGQSAPDWWDSLTYAEHSVILGSANHRNAARELRGNSAAKLYGADAKLDHFIQRAWLYHVNRQNVT